jgi:shikimate dehydrogenase
MKRACVIGWPISHSRSPLIHGFWLRKYGIDGAYTREPVRPENLESYLNSLQTRGFEGCNVTVPHKERAYALAARREPSAVAVEAANTLWFQDGKLVCANTDTYGFLANLADKAPDWKQRTGSIVVLGAGGSARAVIHGFLQEGRNVYVFNRSASRAQDLAKHFGAHVKAFAWEARNTHVPEAAVIVNTTTLGLNGVGDPEIEFSGAQKGMVVADLVYAPLMTAFLKSAEAHGLQTVDGLGMLLHQAVPGFEKWFGVRPEVTPELYDLVAKDIGGP